MDEPELITLLRAAAAKDEDSFGIVVHAPKGASLSPLRIRPVLLSVQPNGGRNYRVTTKQAKKAVKVWDEELVRYWQARPHE